jgi:hypothetical protein
MVTTDPNEAVPTHRGHPVVLAIQHRVPMTADPEGNPELQVVSGQPDRVPRKEHHAPVDVPRHPTMEVAETVEADLTEVDIIKCCLTARVPVSLLIPEPHKAMVVVITDPRETTGMNSKTRRTIAITSHFTA